MEEEMSQKSTRRARRQTTDDEPTSFKAPTPKPNGAENGEETPPPTEETKEATPAQEDAKIEQNGTEKDSIETDSIMTRSRSATPQVKKVNGIEEKEKEEEKQKEEEEKEQVQKEEEKVAEETGVSEEKTETEMDPLIISDEPDPELAFEESSDLESGKSSPILTRCKTRRSASRNIPTPKSPKLVEEHENLTPSPPMEADTTNKDSDQELNATFESCSDDVSTKAQAGGDSTRMDYDYTSKELSNLDNNSFLQEAKSKSFGETLRRLSTRRTIRPVHDDYRRRLLQTTVDKTDYSATYPTRNSVERISSVGIKRKNVSEGDDGYRKRIKSDTSGFLSKFTSPLNSIKNTFRSDIPSSTPKLTGYKDEKFMLEDDGINSKMCEVKGGEQRWCSIM